MKKVVIISWSPRKGKQSEQISEYISDYFKEKNMQVDIIKLSETIVNPCRWCYVCFGGMQCSIPKINQDDQFEEIYPQMMEADVIIVVSPVYFGGVTSQLKAFFDRTFMLRMNDFKLKNKVAAGITIWWSRNWWQEITMQSIHAWMHIHGMIVVGDNGHFGGIVHGKFDKDEIWKETVDATINKVFETLEMMK